jgi:molybdate transport system substrate-binding protein
VSRSITVLSSMATRAMLAELGRAHEARSNCHVALQSVGGIDAAARVRAGETFDVVVLARQAIDELLGAGYLLARSDVDLVRSGVAVAVRAGAPRPDIASEDALRRAVLTARTIGTSTGPSGTSLGKLFARWGITAQLKERIITPPPGIPVGALVASGEIELGFQQRSELAHLEGVDVVGPLPAGVRIVTTFSGALGARTQQPAVASNLLAFLASPETADTKRRHGMDPCDEETTSRSPGP